MPGEQSAFPNSASVFIMGLAFWIGAQGGPVKLDSMWQHQLTRPLHV